MNNDQDLLELLRSGKAPRKARLAAAKALVPLPFHEQLLLLIRLTADPDKIVNAEANTTLEAVPEEQILPVLRTESANPEILEYFCFDPSRSAELVHAAAMNNATPDKTIDELAQIADSSLLETILLNETRLIRHPSILDSILKNPAATSAISRRANEIKTEFFVKVVTRSAGPALSVPGIGNVPEPPVHPHEAVEVEVPFRPEELGLATRQEISTFHRIAGLTTAAKVKLALLGSREERAILIHDSNRVVAASVIKSPKISEQEVETISQMRNISEDILRQLGLKREWIKNYVIVRNLVRNPKTPIALSLKLLSRLLESDLRQVSRDRSIPEMVRRSAARTIQNKSLGH